MLRVLNGSLVASSWPRKRGTPTDRYQLSILERMRQLQQHVKRINDREIEPLRQALDQWNDDNRGQMGTATIRLRDLLTANSSGRWLAFLLPNGQWAVHIDALQDYSRRLDWLEPVIGSMLTRTPTGWRPTTPCARGYVMALTDSNPSGAACAPARYNPNQV